MPFPRRPRRRAARGPQFPSSLPATTTTRRTRPDGRPASNASGFPSVASLTVDLLSWVPSRGYLPRRRTSSRARMAQSAAGGVTRLKARPISESHIVPACVTCTRLSSEPGHPSRSSSGTVVFSTKSEPSTNPVRARRGLSFGGGRSACCSSLGMWRMTRPVSAGSRADRGTSCGASSGLLGIRGNRLRETGPGRRAGRQGTLRLAPR
jgi:hypothetical protein